MKIMLIEDEYLLNKAIKTYLISKGFEIDSFLDGLEAVDAISNGYELFIVDIDIPHITGIEILEQIRKLYLDLPVIIISATIDMDMITQAYSKGCNDYLKKPFDIKELELKIRAFTRNASNIIDLKNNIFYDKENHSLQYQDEIITLTSHEQKLISLLADNRGRIITNEQIEATIWNSNTPHLRQLVNRLRKKLPFEIIQNRIGEGYIIV